MRALNVYSEIGKLNSVLLHRPGHELENLMPELLERLLFDDIPYLKIAQEEHDAFANVLRKSGAEVYYLEDLAAEAIEEPNIRIQMVTQFLKEANVLSEDIKIAVMDYLSSLDNKALIIKMMSGIRKSEVTGFRAQSLESMLHTSYPFIIDPMPNLYFTRDPFSTIGNGISLNKMHTITRNRETIFSSYIFKHHPLFQSQEIPFWYDRVNEGSIEGGDQLILSDKVLAVGLSQRTCAYSVEYLAQNIFKAETSFETVLAFDIPKTRAFMHLDTVFTMVDYDKFTIHPGIEGPLNVYAIQRGKKGHYTITHQTDKLEKTLAAYLKMSAVQLIRCANGDYIDSAREQWNDGSNTLAIAPGEVVVYSRNYATNDLLEKNNIKTHVIPSSELSRGRGGPRCMSMPLNRENL